MQEFLKAVVIPEDVCCFLEFFYTDRESSISGRTLKITY